MNYFKPRISRRHAIFVAKVALMWAPMTVDAQQMALDEVIVTGYTERPRSSDMEASTASRLGLTVRETPAIVDVITDAQLLMRGARSSVEAFKAAPGVSSANLASSPGVLSMRGFTSGAIALLHDGVRLTSSGIVTRNLDSWGFDRIEVLKGPASILHGEGALAGTVNLVPKRAQMDSTAISYLASAGSFDAMRIGIDANTPLGERSAGRLVGSYSNKDGYIDDNAFETVGATLSWTWRASDTVTVDVAADYYADESDASYWGTPLVPAAIARSAASAVKTSNDLVLDRKLRRANYNVAEGLTDANATWLRSRISWEIDDAWSLANELSYYDATRRWHNSETYVFDATTGLLNRSTTFIEHDHQFWSERLVANADSRIAGRRNRFSIGAEYSTTDFFNPRRFGSTTAIDPYGDERGTYPTGDDAATYPGAGNRVDAAADIANLAVFIEDAFSLTPRWLWIAGLRYERIDLERDIIDRNLNTATRFGANYEPFSWRVGTTYELTPRTQAFAQYSSAVVPVGTLVLTSPTNARFDLSNGRSIEAGVKSSLLNDRLDVTLSAFRIELDDILTRDPANSSIVVQGGSQSSHGVELSVSVGVMTGLRVDANVSAIDAQYDELVEAGGANRRGRTPPNVPETVSSLFAIYRFGSLPVSASIGARHAGHFYTNNANTVRVAGHTTVDASLGYRLRDIEITLRGRNLTDELYAEWTGSSATQVLLGEPRSFEVSLTGRF